MAVIRPFKAYRPAPGLENIIAALPYDVYNREEACEVVKANPDSFLSIDRAETQFDASVDTYAEEVYQMAHDRLWDFIAKGKFIQEEKEVYYLYELVMDGRSQTGFVACASIDDYQNNIIKKHENTRADKEADRIHHVDSCNMQTGPIFLAYRQVDTLRDMMKKIMLTTPVYDFVSEDGITHRVWVIDQLEDIDTIKTSFAVISQIYIADGHHRCASAVKVGLKRREERVDGTDAESDYFLSVLFPDEQLMIMDYNRYVKDLNGLSKEQFMAKLEPLFEIMDSETIPFTPSEKATFGMYLDGAWYGLVLKDEFLNSDAVEGLDVSLLQNLVLQPILGIEDPKTDKRIDFIGGIRGMQELERRCNEGAQMGVAFAMYPTSIGELFAVADAGKLMPPKSTWFEPKLRSGLFLHEI